MTDAAETAAVTSTSKSRRLGRSPSYPSFAVAKALENVAALYTQEKEYAAPLASALQAFGYSAKSSGGRQALATMKYYGLIDVAGEGDGRRIKVSEVALKILRDPREDQTEKRKLIRSVALTPAAHQALLGEYPLGLASDGTVLHFLHEQGFNETAARELLDEYKETASTIGLYEPSNDVDKGGKIGESLSDKTSPKIKVGDRVQVTIAGVDQFADGAVVLGFDGDGAWVYTDQAKSAAKLEEVTLLESAEAPAVERPSIPAHLLALKKQDDAPKPGTRRAVFPIDEGDVTLIFPESLSPSGLQDLGDYLDIFLKKEAKKKRAENTAKVLDIIDK